MEGHVAQPAEGDQEMFAQLQSLRSLNMSQVTTRKSLREAWSRRSPSQLNESAAKSNQ
jgi:hypothetical protein